MDANMIFESQLASATPITAEMIAARVADGSLTERSPKHKQYVDHIGERMVFFLVYNVGQSEAKLASQTWIAQIQSCYESDISTTVEQLSATHHFDGYTTTTSPIPRFTVRREENNVTT